MNECYVSPREVYFAFRELGRERSFEAIENASKRFNFDSKIPNGGIYKIIEYLGVMKTSEEVIKALRNRD